MREEEGESTSLGPIHSRRFRIKEVGCQKGAEKERKRKEKKEEVGNGSLRMQSICKRERKKKNTYTRDTTTTLLIPPLPCLDAQMLLSFPFLVLPVCT